MIKAMTVKELIEFLTRIDENLSVMTISYSEEGIKVLCEDDIFIDDLRKQVIL